MRVITPPMGSLEPVAPRAAYIDCVNIIGACNTVWYHVYTEFPNTKVRSLMQKIWSAQSRCRLPVRFHKLVREKATIDDGEKSGNKKSKKEEAPISVKLRKVSETWLMRHSG